MAFDESVILSIAKPAWQAGQLFLRWTTSAPAGTWFQIYVARALAWSGKASYASIPTPSGDCRINIGAVADGEQNTDFSASLPTAPENRIRLQWQGGLYEGLDLASFRIYGETAPGSGIDYAKLLGEVAAYPGGFLIDGWNLGGWNEGGWGFTASDYSWISEPRYSGVWGFAIVPVDSAGNEGTGTVGYATVGVPPAPPAFYADFSRLIYSYDPATQKITLTWNPTPG